MEEVITGKRVQARLNDFQAPKKGLEKDEMRAELRLAIGGLFELVGKEAHHLMKAVIPLHLRRDRLTGVKHGPMITTAEGLADFLQALPSHFATEIHRNHSREGDVRRPTLAGHIRNSQIVAFGHPPLDQLDRHDRLGFLLDKILKELFHLDRSDVAIMQCRPGGYAI